ncbi:diguanylate cyclase [Pontibacterium sp.]|uniref:diguanylate cyclase n=1 Tax=Pontibacterium sp. TaxID=2036026 RepID=UPI0035199749
MRIGIRKKLVALFGLLIALSLVHYFKIKQATEDASRQLEWVEHTHEVIVTSEILLGQLRDAETGQRGYLLTGEPDYLEPYLSGVEGTKSLLTTLQSLTVDNAEQQETLQQVSALVDRKFAELSETIEFARAGDTERALQIVKEDVGKHLLDRIRDQIGGFRKVEQQLLIQREAAYERSQQYLEFLFFAEVIVLILMIFAISIYIQRTLVRPLVVMAKDAKRSESDGCRFNAASTSSDEIGALARALTSMQKAIDERTAELEELSEELKRERDNALQSSVTDALTGLNNRRKFDEVIENELKRAYRDRSYLDLTLLDIDFFKSINDTYGHAKGDEVLKDVAQCLKNMSRRPNDFVFRIGGEEFVFLTSRQDTRCATAFAEQLRASVEALQLPNQGSKVSDFVTVSAGVVSVVPGPEDTTDSLLRAADRRLYKAKSEGRNRVVASD